MIFTAWLVGWLVDWGISFLEQNSVSATPPATTALLLVILGLYDRFLWKLPLFQYMVDVPNMNGRYKGNLNYTFNGKPGSPECTIEIVQTASKIKICTYTKNHLGTVTESTSVAESIVKDESDFYSIYFFYQNGGTKESNQLDSHEGANFLKFIPANNRHNRLAKLKGHYFTNRQTQTKGEIEAEFEGNELKREF
ncbi:Cap15 family cyclic dinucleotide receptor domain-containing protein [Phaeocystidibacter marisrubri]|uniref:CD-NTase-associated protein 15 domain-containing protein n=1 Tax=Phaeocystidibacter marisrubri TaxID=1577780 RepID=A0A6L3ZD53_9FLAO|nr:hypothetical protein [Phaeocystidibacter marisrubri]KAB2815600.1 hypothetical protein F8C82_07810 [Phaeocystidibacter marisrubri]